MLPLRATNYKMAESWPSAIVLHHTACRINATEVAMNKATFQTHKYHLINYKVRARKETGFNFIVDRFKNDYQVVVSQPLMTLCEYEDLDKKYWKSIHIGLMGNYDEDIPMNRMYRVLAYRVLAPVMRLFMLKEENIVFHSTISNDETVTCPGEFMDMSKLITNLRSVLRRKAVARSK